MCVVTSAAETKVQLFDEYLVTSEQKVSRFLPPTVSFLLHSIASCSLSITETMRLLTHNSLKCPAKGVAKGYPLQLEIADMEVDETEVNVEFIRQTLPTLDWEGILVVSQAVGFDGLPELFDAALLEDMEFIRAMHRLLLDIHVTDGTLTCPETGRVFPIKDGIPCMLLPETDV